MRVVIRTAALEQLRQDLHLHRQVDLAAVLRWDESGLSRTIRGHHAVSAGFIANVLTYLPVRFEDMFAVEPDEGDLAAAASRDELAAALEARQAERAAAEQSEHIDLTAEPVPASS